MEIAASLLVVIVCGNHLKTVIFCCPTAADFRRIEVATGAWHYTTGRNYDGRQLTWEKQMAGDL